MRWNQSIKYSSILLPIFFGLSLGGCGGQMEVVSADLESVGDSPLSSESKDTDGPEVKLIVPDELSGEVVFQLQLADPSGISQAKIYINDSIELLPSNDGGTIDYVVPYAFTIANIDQYAGTTIILRVVAFDNAYNPNDIRGNKTLIDYSIEVPAVKTPAPVPQTGGGTAAIFLENGFESGLITKPNSSYEGWDLLHNGIPKNIQVVNSHARTGKYSLKLHLERNQWYYPPPSKVLRPDAPTSRPRSQVIHTDNMLLMEKEYWLGFSMRPENMGVSSNKGVLLFEYHTTSNAVHPVQLLLATSGDKVVWKIGWGPVGNMQSKTLWEAPLSEVNNKWTDFIVRFVPSYTNKGQVEIWVNGAPAGKHLNSPNQAWNADGSGKSPSVKLYPVFALYKFDFIDDLTGVQDYTIYYDQIVMAEGTKGYNLVNPANYH